VRNRVRDPHRSNTNLHCSLGRPPKVSNPNLTAIRAAVLAGRKRVTETDRLTDTPRQGNIGRNSPHFMNSMMLERPKRKRRPGFGESRPVVNSAHVLQKYEFRPWTVERRVRAPYSPLWSSNLGRPTSGRDLGGRAGSGHTTAVRQCPVDWRLHAAARAPRHADPDRLLVRASIERVDRKDGVGQWRTDHHGIIVARLRHYSQEFQTPLFLVQR